MEITQWTLIGKVVTVLIVLFPFALANMAKARGLQYGFWWVLGVIPIVNLAGLVYLVIKPRQKSEKPTFDQANEI